jgi:hypothetical protein
MSLGPPGAIPWFEPAIALLSPAERHGPIRVSISSRTAASCSARHRRALAFRCRTRRSIMTLSTHSDTPRP